MDRLEILNKRHTDWPWPLSYIPRRWTACDWGVPVLVMGNQRETREDAASHTAGPAPVGEAGSWQLSLFPKAPGPLKHIPTYFAFTLKNGWHFRIGARWDDVDSYTQVPTLAIRKYTGNRIEDTST